MVQLARTLREMLPLVMLGVTVTSPGRFDTETERASPFASDAVPTTAIVGVGVPRATVIPEGLMLNVGAMLLDGMVRFASEMSKKMLPTASTLMRPWVVATFAVLGIVTMAEPLFGTLAASTNGNA